MLTPREKKVKKRTPAPRPHINVGKICKFQRMFFFFDASPTASQINVATLILGEGQGKYITLKRTFHKNQWQITIGVIIFGHDCLNFVFVYQVSHAEKKGSTWCFWPKLAQIASNIQYFPSNLGNLRKYTLRKWYMTSNKAVIWRHILVMALIHWILLDSIGLYVLHNALQGSYHTTAHQNVCVTSVTCVTHI